MRVLITKGYTDRLLNRNVRKDEELTVSEARAKLLASKGYAEIISEDITDYKNKIAELENTIIDKDAKIAELEKKKK